MAGLLGYSGMRVFDDTQWVGPLRVRIAARSRRALEAED